MKQNLLSAETGVDLSENLSKTLEELKEHQYDLTLAVTAILELLFTKGVITPEQFAAKAAELNAEAREG